MSNNNTVLDPHHATVPQLLALAALDSDAVSCFPHGTSWEDADSMIMVVKGRNVARQMYDTLVDHGLVTDGKPVATIAELAVRTEEAEELQRLKDLINTPETSEYLRGVHLEAVHQVERWGAAADRAKRPADWFWLVGYLAGKALHAANSGNTEKALHHCISTSAALLNWHCAIKGQDVRMCPGRSDLAELVEREFPGASTACEA